MNTELLHLGTVRDYTYGIRWTTSKPVPGNAVHDDPNRLYDRSENLDDVMDAMSIGWGNTARGTAVKAYRYFVNGKWQRDAQWALKVLKSKFEQLSTVVDAWDLGYKTAPEIPVTETVVEQVVPRSVVPDTILDGPWLDRRIHVDPFTGKVVDTTAIRQTLLKELKADTNANIFIKKIAK